MPRTDMPEQTTVQPIRTDHVSVARAVRYLELWLHAGSPYVSDGVDDAVRTLAQFARERVVDTH